jgi:glyoxylase-like metal-dependent hydrolase (beta-lactamase superfamily II)
VHLDSLERAAALEPDLLLPGHGRPVHQHIADRIRFSIDATTAERDRVLELIGDEPQTPYAISFRFAPDGADLDCRQASLSVVLSLVDHLSSHGLVESWIENGLRQVRRAP